MPVVAIKKQLSTQEQNIMNWDILKPLVGFTWNIIFKKF